MSELTSPLHAAMAVYQAEPCARSFGEDLLAHLRHGYVHSTPRYIVMARPVTYLESGQNNARIIDSEEAFPEAEWNCWHIYLLAGDLRAAASQFPFGLAWVSWERRNQLRAYRMKSLLRHL